MRKRNVTGTSNRPSSYSKRKEFQKSLLQHKTLPNSFKRPDIPHEEPSVMYKTAPQQQFFKKDSTICTKTRLCATRPNKNKNRSKSAPPVRPKKKFANIAIPTDSSTPSSLYLTKTRPPTRRWTGRYTDNTYIVQHPHTDSFIPETERFGPRTLPDDKSKRRKLQSARQERRRRLETRVLDAYAREEERNRQIRTNRVNNIRKERISWLERVSSNSY
ncbi:hypothetical protein PCE1_004513 [Barthelona sp. PCE]